MSKDILIMAQESERYNTACQLKEDFNKKISELKLFIKNLDNELVSEEEEQDMLDGLDMFVADCHPMKDDKLEDLLTDIADDMLYTGGF